MEICGLLGRFHVRPQPSFSSRKRSVSVTILIPRSYEPLDSHAIRPKSADIRSVDRRFAR